MTNTKVYCVDCKHYRLEEYDLHPYCIFWTNKEDRFIVTGTPIHTITCLMARTNSHQCGSEGRSFERRRSILYRVIKAVIGEFTQ